VAWKGMSLTGKVELRHRMTYFEPGLVLAPPR